MFQGVFNTKSHCDNQASELALLGLQARKPNTQGGNTRPPTRKVIAMVANVAAFGLRGSSQT